ncbi:hypothetical protein [Erythrobacter mangrovi]|uniref:Uncharacterized protein n=1 Tax=Erythrobacter mangrovi TaxID=2739433 RepID=A0A7D3XB09_9SPHN|nr:hypothetical protein [Erythrobacter mangrovi]QKG72235.1 hypothetical protein HQR01_13145 [Erythrobacter mangrovi]
MLAKKERVDAVASLKAFADRHSGLQIESTGATVVTYSGVLFNVKGSTPDPKIGGLTWKALLERYSVDGWCYADTPPAPGGSSHPDFSVGGHVTPNEDGSVPTGGTCYLMPLCYWHNGKANDGQPFEHSETRMLQLTGYMTGDLAATFIARMAGAAPLALVYLDETGLAFRSLADEPEAVDAALETAAAGGGKPAHVLLRRRGAGETATYTIDRAQFAD